MISTHILDLQTGQPAENVTVILEKENNTVWSVLSDQKTNSDGRIKFDVSTEAGVYRLQFKISDYLKANGSEPFFIEAPVTFEINDTTRNYHVPLLLSPYGYSTYRGS